MSREWSREMWVASVGRECESRNLGGKIWVVKVGRKCELRMWGCENKNIGGICNWDSEGSNYLIIKCVRKNK